MFDRNCLQLTEDQAATLKGFTRRMGKTNFMSAEWKAIDAESLAWQRAEFGRPLYNSEIEKWG